MAVRFTASPKCAGEVASLERNLIRKQGRNMPNQYVRSSDHRGRWSQEDLSQAIEAVNVKNFSVRNAALVYGVPRKTLERRLKSKNFLKGPLGPSSLFGEDNEKRLSRHIISMQKSGFAFTPNEVRNIAYKFAVQLGLKHSFNVEKERAGYVWLKSFLSRNPGIRIRKAEGVSLARCQSMNRREVNTYFDLLYDVLEKYHFDKPSNIFNIDESGLQLNSRPGHVLAQKGSKAVSAVTSTEKGETITIIACCNAEGSFLPPACIMKGKNKKQEWQDGMPPGSVLYMSQKSAYINSDLFFEWLKTHFLPRRPAGKVLLILDGHASHCNSVEMLEFASTNDIYLLSLPSHTTHYLQPLDRAVFKSVKSFYYEACRLWLKKNPGRRLTRLQFGELLSACWVKAATPENAIAGFAATGIYPFNRSAVPDYAFEMLEEHSNGTMEQTKEHSDMPEVHIQLPGPSTSRIEETSPTIELTALTDQPAEETPTKLLTDLSPVPDKKYQARKRSKQVATLLTSDNHLKYRKECDEKKNMMILKKQIKQEKCDEGYNETKNKPQKKKSRKPKQEDTTDSEDEDELILLDSGDSSGMDEEGLDDCVGCGENYYKSEKIEQWLQCITCLRWVHENCTEFNNYCHSCGKKQHKEKENTLLSNVLKGKGKGKGKGRGGAY